MTIRSLILILGICIAAGCTRAFYRKSADNESYPIITDRIRLPEYDIGRIELTPPDNSRLADSFNPDRPPKPPDDPVAAIFMKWPGGMHGAWTWEKDGVTDQIEPDNWVESLGLNDKGVLVLDQEKATEIALRNSREYQTALEQVYLTALTLTLNRFEFDMRWFGRNGTLYAWPGGADPQSVLTSNSNLGFERNFAAGGQLLVDFANSFVYQSGGGKGQIASNIAVNLVQPLLRNAGRKVRLEALTQAERDVLYAVRDFARFRKQFWAETAIQGGGYLDLLLSLQTLRNNQANLGRQEETYRLYTELLKGGRASVVELDQFYQSYQAAKQAVMDAEASLQTSEDNFKMRLGIPPRMAMDLDDSPLKKFVLTDPAIEKQRTDLEAFQRERFKELDEALPPDTLRKHFDSLEVLIKQIEVAIAGATGDLETWGKKIQDQTTPDEIQERARATYQGLKSQLPDLTPDLKKLQKRVAEHRQKIDATPAKESWTDLMADVKSALAVLDSAVTIQTQSRIHLIELPAIDTTEEKATMFAKANRMDLQNRLAEVTDAWRKVAVAANGLRGDLAIVASANIGTDPVSGKAFDFASDTSRYTVGVEFDGPLNRLAERNIYRASLITYQRAKRLYVGLSDQIEQQIRADLRELNRLRSAFEVARQQLLSAARQYENARLILLGPRDGRSANDTTTLNLLQALSNLLAARNSLAASYINFEQQRIQLLLDLEELQLDQRGFPTNATPRIAGETDFARDS